MNLAVIPARGGSKRIPKKNIKEFFGKPIVAYSIETAIASKLFDRVIVSTDDKEIADTVIQYGAEVPFMRPADLSDDYIGTTPVVSHAVKWMMDQGYEVKTPQFDGDENAFVQAHQDNLRYCDGVLIYFGSASGQWVDMKLMDLLKAPGYGRSKPLTAKAVYVAPPDNRRKTRFRTRTAEVIQAGNSINPDELKPFLGKINRPKGGLS